VFIVDLDDRLSRAFSSPRISSGVVVIARSPGLNVYTSDLRPGDIVHQLNRQTVESVQQLSSLLKPMKAGQPVVLEIERGTRLQYVAFEWGD
jgi:S1-C subfamily serine protease